MLCPKCKQEIPDASRFCFSCGWQLDRPKRRPKHSPNGTGYAYRRRGQKTWTAEVVIGWRDPPPFDPENPENRKQRVPIKRTKGGFKTKPEALAYCSALRGDRPDVCTLSLKQIYDQWLPWYAPRVDKETLGCYKAAFGHFAKIHEKKFVTIAPEDLQKCLDDCPRGHRTHQNMKVTAGLLWKYGVDRGYVPRDIAENLYIGKGKSVQRDPLTDAEVQLIRGAIGKERYAEYLYCLCYLGFRPGEFLSLRKDHYRTIDGYEVLVNGSKTEAGKDRVVIIPPQVLDIVRSRLFVPGTDLLFPQYCFKRQNDVLKGFKQMGDDYFNKHVFKPLAAKLGFSEGKVPYSARHTYSDKLKNAEGTDKAKASMIGHTDYAFTQSHYQSTDLEDLLAVAISIE